MKLSPLLVRWLHGSLAQRGRLDAPALEALRASLPQARDLYLPMAVDAELLALLEASLANDPALGLRAGDAPPVQVLGILGLLIAEAATFHAALTALQRYWPLLCSSGRCVLRSEGDVVHLVIELDAEPAVTRRLLISFTFAFVCQVARSFTQDAASPAHVSLPYAALDQGTLYAELFGCPPRFEVDRAELGLPAAWLDLPRAYVNEVLLEALEPAAEAVLSRVARDAPMRARVYSLLAADADLRETDVNGLAKQLGISVSKLRQALHNEGETLFAIADEVRVARALVLLTERSLTIRAISERLGYSQPSAFHRAFKRKTGMSPQHFRQQQDAS